ncbi:MULTISPECIES: LysR family transcriptional regulator [Dyella]|uniref:LysR family transcriptional regulator n=2 Tax=Dyella TaxID=231454 RepID=A0A4R0YTT4_9GAMM|nr:MULTISPECIES: LysR family transcriptional regulator [Dyella]TBR40577.1 LysR family transcriptional regulator [Dyella terrae]TCI11841.1 LysR family transcriptional regulator [Dyella soli]
MDKLENMAVFVRVVERGSFAAAAEDFRISPAMAGVHVRTLEERLGARLIHRTTRRHSTTEIGRLYYERCKQILADVSDADACAAQLKSRPQGRLRVASPVSFSVHALAPSCRDYIAENPEVSIDLVVSDRPVDMLEEAIDVAVRIGELEDSSMIARSLRPYRSLICAAPDYLDRYGHPEKPSDLSSHRCLGFAHPVASSEWTLSGPQGTIRVPVTLALTANNGEALRMAALSGLGIIMQPEILLGDDVRAGRLVPLLAKFLVRPKPMHVLTFPDRKPTPKIRSFVDFLVARFGESDRASSLKDVP